MKEVAKLLEHVGEGLKIVSGVEHHHPRLFPLDIFCAKENKFTYYYIYWYVLMTRPYVLYIGFILLLASKIGCELQLV